MHSETERAVERLRRGASAVRAQLDAAIAVLGTSKNTGVSENVGLATNLLEDIETHHIADLVRETVPPRTLANERMLIRAAEIHLSAVVLPIVNDISDMAKRYSAGETDLKSKAAPSAQKE